MTVIEEVVYRRMPLVGVISVFVMCGIGLCFGLVLIPDAWRNIKSRGRKVILAIYSVMLVSGCVWACVFSINQYHQVDTEYIVDIGEDVGYHEFHDKWEVVAQEGEYYRIKEK